MLVVVYWLNRIVQERLLCWGPPRPVGKQAVDLRLKGLPVKPVYSRSFQLYIFQFQEHNQWRIQDFPRGGGAPTPKVGTRTYFFGQKLHENKEFWPPGGRGARPWRPPLRSATDNLPIMISFAVLLPRPVIQPKIK